ncbi:hypothetical protein COJ82_04930 [Bacillus cereus]|nr:hypothetical protein COJ82_04930 [Bacillus cereus]
MGNKTIKLFMKIAYQFTKKESILNKLMSDSSYLSYNMCLCYYYYLIKLYSLLNRSIVYKNCTVFSPFYFQVNVIYS